MTTRSTIPPLNTVAQTGNAADDLLLAVIHQACKDAIAGSDSARQWLEGTCVWEYMLREGLVTPLHP